MQAAGPICSSQQQQKQQPSASRPEPRNSTNLHKQQIPTGRGAVYLALFDTLCDQLTPRDNTALHHLRCPLRPTSRGGGEYQERGGKGARTCGSESLKLGTCLQKRVLDSALAFRSALRMTFGIALNINNSTVVGRSVLATAAPRRSSRNLLG